MTRILLSGCNGRLGQFIVAATAGRKDVEIVAGVDINTTKTGKYPVFADPLEFSGEADVIIDCSHPTALAGVLDYAQRKKIAAVLCTTGYADEDLQKISDASKNIAIFRSANMSLGVALLADLAKKAAALLGEQYDVEIIERHHNKKLDAPSGTAMMLADAVTSALPYDAEYIYDRHSVRAERGKREIGIHAVRGGTITGDHTVLFAGTDETIELSHSASSRAVFANGALKAAVFLHGKPSGIYGMPELVAEF